MKTERVINKEEIERLLKYTIDNIIDHLQEIEWKKQHRHILTYTDKVLMLSESELLMKITKYLDGMDK